MLSVAPAAERLCVGRVQLYSTAAPGHHFRFDGAAVVVAAHLRCGDLPLVLGGHHHGAGLPGLQHVDPGSVDGLGQLRPVVDVYDFHFVSVNGERNFAVWVVGDADGVGPIQRFQRKTHLADVVRVLCSCACCAGLQTRMLVAQLVDRVACRRVREQQEQDVHWAHSSSRSVSAAWHCSYLLAVPLNLSRSASVVCTRLFSRSTSFRAFSSSSASSSR